VIDEAHSQLTHSASHKEVRKTKIAKPDRPGKERALQSITNDRQRGIHAQKTISSLTIKAPAGRRSRGDGQIRAIKRRVELRNDCLSDGSRAES